MLFPCLCFKHLVAASPADPALLPRLDLLGGGGRHLLEKLSLVAWISLAEQPPAFPSHPEVPTVGAVAGGCWAAVAAQPLARLFKLSLSQVRAPGCPSTAKNTARPRFGVIPAQVRAAGGHPPGRVCSSPRGRSFDFTSEAAQRSSATDLSWLSI